MGYFLSILSGILMSIQGIFNTQTTKQTSIWIAASFVQFSALVMCLIAWVITGREGSFFDLLHVKPWYYLLGGIFGAFITYTVIVGMKQLGPAQAVLFIIIAQILSAYLIEIFGLFGEKKPGFDWMKLLGIVAFILGVVLFKWKDLFEK